MKQYTLLCIGCLLTWITYAQEFKFYLNGSIVEDSAYVESFQEGDLMRVLFSGKSTSYNFRIATLMVTLTPRNSVGTESLPKPTSFVLDNASNEFSSYPSFTFELMDRLALLKDNDCDMTIKVNQLFSDSQEGTDWIANNVKFKTITIRKRNAGLAGK
jgi:hypothetical protein